MVQIPAFISTDLPGYLSCVEGRICLNNTYSVQVMAIIEMSVRVKWEKGKEHWTRDRNIWTVIPTSALTSFAYPSHFIFLYVSFSFSVK